MIKILRSRSLKNDETEISNFFLKLHIKSDNALIALSRSLRIYKNIFIKISGSTWTRYVTFLPHSPTHLVPWDSGNVSPKILAKKRGKTHLQSEQFVHNPWATHLLSRSLTKSWSSLNKWSKWQRLFDTKSGQTRSREHDVSHFWTIVQTFAPKG